jgi:hypothetical protein
MAVSHHNHNQHNYSQYGIHLNDAISQHNNRKMNKLGNVTYRIIVLKAECSCAECHLWCAAFCIATWSVVILSAVALNVMILSAVMLSTVAPRLMSLCKA